MVRLPVVCLALSVLALSCVPLGRSGPSPFERRSSDAAFSAADVMVEVQNQHWLEMRVWVEWPGARHLLGNVEPGGSAVFQVPGQLMRRPAEPRLYAESVGSIDEVHTGPIDLTAGHRIEWRLKRVLANSRPRVM